MALPLADNAGRSAGCVGEDELHRFVQGSVGVKRGREIGAHVSECSACRDLLDLLEDQTIESEAPRAERAVLSLSLSLGDEIDGRFRIDRELGRGGMGVVYAARHLAMDRACAVKVLTDRIIADEESIHRFIRETRLLAKLESPHVVKVFDVGRLPSGAPYMVMELLEGEDLERTIRRESIPVVRAAEYVLEACEGVGEAHASGIVHRDLKLENLFLARAVPSPIVKVLDFGIAKGGREIGEGSLTRAETIMGTPRYMPPEQIVSARNADARSDVWALGVCLYRLMTGKYPFDGPHVAALWARISAASPVRPSTRCSEVTPALEAVVLRCLAREPADRYENAVELAAALRDALLDLPTLSDSSLEIMTPRVPSEPIARTVGRASPPPPTESSEPSARRVATSPEPPPSFVSVTIPVVRSPAPSISDAPPPPALRPSFPEAPPPLSLPAPPAPLAPRTTRSRWPLVALVAVTGLVGFAVIAAAAREKKVVAPEPPIDSHPAKIASASPPSSSIAEAPTALPVIELTSPPATSEPRRASPGVHRPRPTAKPVPAASSSERHYERM